MNGNYCGVIMSYYPSILMQAMKKRKKECQDRRCPSHDSNRASSGYKSDLLRPGQTFSILKTKKVKNLFSRPVLLDNVIYDATTAWRVARMNTKNA
jgi:hypothetical protein